ncbi:IS4 family transposase [Pseudalkalibacillus sp. R45]|uniref:IS4 family transposase n=1 Tax=Pseudalkalibacillus sp. R45 TaxID=3457433 RepID=UPI003FCCEF78
MGNIISDYPVFQKCLSTLEVEKYRCPFHDHGAKKLLSGQTIVLLIEAQLQQRDSLENISENLRARKDFQEYLLLDCVHPSTIHRKLEKLPTNYLKSLYTEVVKQIGNKHASKCEFPDFGLLGIIDATEVSLPGRAKWAYSTKDKNGVKLHTRLKLLDLDTSLADKVIPSTAAVSDKEAVEYLVDDKDVTYVFDRGYIKYHLYNQWTKNDINFVARVNANSKLTVLSKQVTEEGAILTDADVEVRDPVEDETFILRLIEYIDDKKRKYRVVTNRWDLNASDIAEIYRLRWRIELFFKWIKQHLKVVKWFNSKPEAVWNQIYLIMIAYAICEWIKLLLDTPKTTWEVLKLLRHYWFGPWDQLIDVLNRKPIRSSNGRRKKGKPGRPRKYPKKYKSVKIINI